MQKVILTVGIPASGKSTWSKAEIAKNPNKTTRICRDDLRNMMHNYTFSDSNEKMVTSVKEFTLLHALKKGHDVIIDECHANRRYFNETCTLIKGLDIDCMVMEKSFYIDLEEALKRNAQREGTAKIPEDAIKKFWKKLGGEQHKFYNPRVEILNKTNLSAGYTLMKQDQSLPKAAIFDLDGTMCNISHRNPYDASTCDKDEPYDHVINMCKLLHDSGVKIVFLSGREDRYEELTRLWLDTYFGEDYTLYMRPTNNFSKDSIIKKDIFEKQIKDKYNVVAVVDDRLQVCRLWYELGLPLFRVGNPDASF